MMQPLVDEQIYDGAVRLVTPWSSVMFDPARRELPLQDQP